MRFNKLPPRRKLVRLFAYDENTGELRWRVTLSNRAPAGSVAGMTPSSDPKTCNLREAVVKHRRPVMAARPELGYDGGYG